MEAANRVVKDTNARKNDGSRPPGTIFERGAAAFRDSVLRDIHAKHVGNRMALQTKFYDQQASLNGEYARLLRNLQSTAQAKSSESVADEQKQIEAVRASFAQDPWEAMKKYQSVPQDGEATETSTTTTARQDSATMESPPEDTKPVKVWSPPATKDEAQLLVDYATSHVVVNGSEGISDGGSVNGKHNNGKDGKATRSELGGRIPSVSEQEAKPVGGGCEEDKKQQEGVSMQAGQKSISPDPICLD